MGVEFTANDAEPPRYFALPPYHVETFPIGSCVCNKDGLNCLSFRSKPGAIFTTTEVANRVAEIWNKGAIHG